MKWVGHCKLPIDIKHVGALFQYPSIIQELILYAVYGVQCIVNNMTSVRVFRHYVSEPTHKCPTQDGEEATDLQTQLVCVVWWQDGV